MLVTFSEKPPPAQAQFTYHFSFHFQIPEIRSPRCSYKKERKKNVNNVLREAHPSKFTYPFQYSTPIFRSGVQESVPTKKKGKRTLVMFSEKPPTRSSPISLTISVSTSKFQRSGVQENVPT